MIDGGEKGVRRRIAMSKCLHIIDVINKAVVKEHIRDQSATSFINKK